MTASFQQGVTLRSAGGRVGVGNRDEEWGGGGGRRGARVRGVGFLGASFRMIRQATHLLACN